MPDDDTRMAADIIPKVEVLTSSFGAFILSLCPSATSGNGAMINVLSLTTAEQPVVQKSYI